MSSFNRSGGQVCGSAMRHFIALVIAVLACGCSTMKVTAQSNEAVDFSKLKTYAWILGPQPANVSAQPAQNAELDRVVHEVIDAALEKRGYVKDTTGNPDFLISYHATLN